MRTDAPKTGDTAVPMPAPRKGRDLKGHFSVWVSGNRRITFTFDGRDTVLVDYLDCH